MDEIAKLRKLCQKWGGDLVELPEKDFESLLDGYIRHGSSDRFVEVSDFHPCPFNASLGVRWGKKHVYYTRAARGFWKGSVWTDLSEPVSWTDVIHEMGHVFASAKRPDQADEYNFFGWEYALARQVGDPEKWRRANKDYSVGSGDDLGSLSVKKQKALILEQYRKAVELGLVVRGRAVPIKRRKRRGW